MNRDDLKTSNLVEYNVPGSNQKHDELGYQFVLEVTDLDSEDDSNESIFSIQAETTVSAKDTSDISTVEDSDKFYSGEYELASLSDEWLHPWSFDRNISSESSPHQPVDTAIREWVAQTKNGTGSSSDIVECSDKELDSDSDFSVFSCRFEFCVMCSSRNDNPSFQFCHSCYQIKKAFFPEKPARRRKRKRNARASSGERAAKRCKPVDEAKTELRAGSVSPEASCSVAGVDSGFESLNSQGSSQSGDSQPDGPSSESPIPTSSTKRVDAEGAEKCLACSQNAINALFVHGMTGHRACCYTCAKRIWFGSRRCPICRSKVNNIIRILNV